MCFYSVQLSQHQTEGSVKGIYGRDLEVLRFEKSGFGSKRLRKVFTAILPAYGFKIDVREGLRHAPGAVWNDAPLSQRTFRGF